MPILAPLRLALRLCVEELVSREGAKEDAKTQRSQIRKVRTLTFLIWICFIVIYAFNKYREGRKMPDWKNEIRRRMSRLKLAPARESEIVEELAQHLDDRYQELLAGGTSASDAERLTLADLSETELFRELQTVERKTPPEPIVI